VNIGLRELLSNQQAAKDNAIVCDWLFLILKVCTIDQSRDRQLSYD
jgi:hypothetical protein